MSLRYFPANRQRNFEGIERGQLQVGEGETFKESTSSHNIVQINGRPTSGAGAKRRRARTCCERSTEPHCSILHSTQPSIEAATAALNHEEHEGHEGGGGRKTDQREGTWRCNIGQSNSPNRSSHCCKTLNWDTSCKLCTIVNFLPL